jgi:hypothetical protein
LAFRRRQWPKAKAVVVEWEADMDQGQETPVVVHRRAWVWSAE